MYQTYAALVSIRDFFFNLTDPIHNCLYYNMSFKKHKTTPPLSKTYGFLLIGLYKYVQILKPSDCWYSRADWSM